MSTRRHRILWQGASLACAALLGACATGQPDDGGGGGDAQGQPDGGFVPQADAAPPPPDAMPSVTEVTLTHSTSMTVQDDNMIACFNAGLGFTPEASYYRVFDLAAAGITRPLTIDNVKVGIETAQSGGGAGQPAAVRLHTLNGQLRLANLTEIGVANITVQDQDVTVLDVPVSATAPVGSTLVAEFFVPDGQAGSHILFPGSNEAGQSGPTYVRDGCGGAEEPTDLAPLIAPEIVHLVLAVEGSW